MDEDEIRTVRKNLIRCGTVSDSIRESREPRKTRIMQPENSLSLKLIIS